MQGDRENPDPETKKAPVILHILPGFGIGGAELAACSCATKCENVHILYLCAPEVEPGPKHDRISFGNSRTSLNLGSVRAAIDAIRTLNPDIVVFSLWRTMFAFAAARLVFPRKTVVSMVHSDRSVHAVDYLWTRISAIVSHAVWADSGSSLERVTRRGENSMRRTLSFVMRNLAPVERGRPGPTFMCWARLSDAKNFPLALAFIDRIRPRFPDVHFRIIGPDAGVLSEIREKVRDLKLQDAVSISDAMTIEQISEESANASFFLQLSKYEGMAMSVVEAMQLGLVPIVTPVGEPARYCRNMENAVIFSDFDQAVHEVCRLIDEPELYAKVSRAAVATWTDAPVYADDFVAAATELWRGRRGA